MSYELHLGDCLEVMRTFPDNVYDSIVTDPPYGLKFMSKNWDHGIPGVPFWAEMLRVAKPGAILMAFGGTRTHHRLMVAIEDAGWELRDTIMWLYGSGFPKSHNISAAIDKADGVEREIIGYKPIAYPDSDCWGIPNRNTMDESFTDNNAYGKDHRTQRQKTAITAPATDAAKLWEGWGSALKPAWEPIIVAMKPLEKTFAHNALAHGLAGLWVDGVRIPTNDKITTSPSHSTPQEGWDRPWRHDPEAAQRIRDNKLAGAQKAMELGRWPSNLILSESAADLLDEMSGELTSGKGIKTKAGSAQGNGQTMGHLTSTYDKEGIGGDTGGASRYFTVLPDSEPRFCYTAKASRGEREEGLEDLPEHDKANQYGDGLNSATKIVTAEQAQNGVDRGSCRNFHPTVKPLELMRWLVRLTKTPTGGSVLDPFAGSGTTGVACLLEGRKAVLVERESEYFEIMRHRMEHWQDEASTEPRKLRGKDSDLSGMPLFADIVDIGG